MVDRVAAFSCVVKCKGGAAASHIPCLYTLNLKQLLRVASVELVNHFVGDIVCISSHQDVVFRIVAQDNVVATIRVELLEEIGECEPEYAEASRLRKFLKYFRSVPADQVPPTSLLREFAGGSSFKY
jgi:hypothetical protein